MSKFDVDYKKLSTLLLPMCMRRERIMALAQTVIAGVRVLNTEFAKFRSDQEYRLTHNGQTCYLRAVLNDTFDPILRGITITENESNEDNGIVLYKEETGKFHMLPNYAETGNASTLYRYGYNGVLRYGFWINIPAYLDGKDIEARVRAVANQYKLAGMRFGITHIK